MASTAAAHGSARGALDPDTTRALRAAAVLVVDEAFMDLVELGAAPMGRQPFLVSTIYLPRRYRERYDMEFLKRWAIALTVVGLELARPEVRRLSCIAEKLALHTVIRMATDRAIELGERPPELAPLWEDLAGHEVLTLLQPGAVPPGLEFDRWFTGAGEHPFYRSRATGSA